MQGGDAELCCICFEQVCTIEVQNCSHEMCAHCILALCCHSKPNSSSKIPVCPFCRSTITRLAVAKTKVDTKTELEPAPAKPRTRISLNLGEGSSSFKSLSSLSSFGRLGRSSGKVVAECDHEMVKAWYRLPLTPTCWGLNINSFCTDIRRRDLKMKWNIFYWTWFKVQMRFHLHFRKLNHGFSWKSKTYD